MDDEEEEYFPPPTDAYLFAFPDDPILRTVQEAYKTSPGTTRLISERSRKLYPEAIIENDRLGPLKDLCVRALAKLGARNVAPAVKESRINMRLHYDSLDVNLPLKDCYFVEDVRFWRRVVFAKCDDITLKFKKLEDYDWRGRGISAKYVELVETCPAAFWPEKEMADLAMLVRDFVSNIHISRLQSLKDASFLSYVESVPVLGASSEESIQSEVSSDEQDTCEELEEESIEEELVPPPKKIKPKEHQVEAMETMDEKRHVEIRKTLEDKRHVEVRQTLDDKRPVGFQLSSEIETKESEEDIEGAEAEKLLKEAMLRQASILNDQLKRRKARSERNEARQMLRDFRLEKKRENERRKANQELLKIRPKVPKAKKNKGEKKVVEIDGVFDLVVEPEPEDNEDKILDKRNKDLLLRRIKRYDYPHKDCHHINLSFLRYFDLLTSLTIEFLGPKMEFGYHKRHTRFSYDDMSHLAKGIRGLHQLKILRFRNSLMDNIKLIILVKALRNLENLEVVDLGCDDLDDSCSVALEMLLDRKIMLKSLELEYNRLENHFMAAIGNVLKMQAYEHPEGANLEYLGLGHNLLCGTGLEEFFHKIIGTNHIQKLNLNGVGVFGERMVHVLNYLLRHHSPLRHLDMAANSLNPICGKKLICALETNLEIIHFDCRGCGLSEDQEYDADVIVRRNQYIKENKYLGDVNITEKDIPKALRDRRLPITAKLNKEKTKRDECLLVRPAISHSSVSIREEEVYEEVETKEVEFDIWQTLANLKTPEVRQQSTVISLESAVKRFSYNANSFDLNEVRDHLCVPGPQNRYYYFRRQRDML